MIFHFLGMLLPKVVSLGRLDESWAAIAIAGLVGPHRRHHMLWPDSSYAFGPVPTSKSSDPVFHLFPLDEPRGQFIFHTAIQPGFPFIFHRWAAAQLAFIYELFPIRPFSSFPFILLRCAEGSPTSIFGKYIYPSTIRVHTPLSAYNRRPKVSLSSLLACLMFKWTRKVCVCKLAPIRPFGPTAHRDSN